MSYDIYFFDGSARAITKDNFVTFFENRPHWTVDKKVMQAVYQNDATCVYFTADYEEQPEDANSDIRYPCVSLNVNYFRPPFFGIEMASELDAFHQNFAAHFFDPQRGGMGAGEPDAYSVAGFLAGYNIGNRFAYAAITQRLIEEGDASPICVADAKLMNVWRWNRDIVPSLKKRFDDEGVDILVASALWAELPEEGGQPLVTATWTDGVRAAIPLFVDRIILVTEDILKRRGLMALFNSRVAEPKMSFATVEELSSLECSQIVESDGIDYLFVDFDVNAPPKDVMSLYRNPRPLISESFSFIAADGILSAELMAEARADDTNGSNINIY